MSEVITAKSVMNNLPCKDGRYVGVVTDDSVVSDEQEWEDKLINWQYNRKW